MADYIDKNILCQAYVHVELPEGITEVELEVIKSHLIAYANSRAKFFVYPEVTVDVEFRDGSLKSYITIAGAICVAISSYGNFRTGVDYLYTDIKRLADTLISESLFMTKARYENVKRTEARTGVIGSLKQLVDDVSLLEGSLGQISVDEASRRLKRIKEDGETLLANVRDPQDVKEIEDELERFATSLPPKCPHPIERVPDDAAVIAYFDILTELRKAFVKRRLKRTSSESQILPKP